MNSWNSDSFDASGVLDDVAVDVVSDVADVAPSTHNRVQRYFDKWVIVALDVVLMNRLEVSVDSLSG